MSWRSAELSVLDSNTESSPSMEHSSFRRFFMAGIPASWVSRRCFSSLRDRRVLVSRASILQPPSPSNCSRWVWNFLLKYEIIGNFLLWICYIALWFDMPTYWGPRTINIEQNKSMYMYNFKNNILLKWWKFFIVFASVNYNLHLF